MALALAHAYGIVDEADEADDESVPTDDGLSD